MNFYKFLFTFCTLLVFISCGPNEEDVLPSPVSFDETLLLNCWKHSFDEDVADKEDVFRPCDFQQFPGSLYTKEFHLFDSDSCLYLELSPVDAHLLESGTWNFDGISLLTIYRKSGDLFLQETITELEENKLVLESN